MRPSRTHCCAIRRYLVVFIAIALLPVLFVYLATNDQVRKFRGAETFNETKQALIADDSIRKLSDDEILLMEDRMERRKKYLNEKCAENGLNIEGKDTLHKPSAWEFLVSREHHIIWCNVFKAASSSWMYNFNILAGYTPEFLKKTHEVPLVLARKRYPRVSVSELREAQNDSITFLISRHPFERLLSAYKDKFMHARPNSFHDKLGSKIIRAYRNKNKPDQPKTRYPSFYEFVCWLLNEIQHNPNMDMHLVPITKFCVPCLMHFDIIIKFETLHQDQIYLIEKAGLQRIIAPEWENPGKGKNTVDVVEQFYSQINRKQLDRLYEYYKYDFEVFKYNVTSYYNIVKDIDDDNGR